VLSIWLPIRGRETGLPIAEFWMMNFYLTIFALMI
jgi:hypothetical protein